MTLVKRLNGLGIPAPFAKQCSSDYDGPNDDDGFIAFVIWKWRQAKGQPTNCHYSAPPPPFDRPMTDDWVPDDITYQSIERQGIKLAFAKYCLIGFRLYWIERGLASATWNNRFILHVNHQYAYHYELEQRRVDPTPIPLDWSPDQRVFDILKNDDINNDFAINLVQEFVMYWAECQRKQFSWNITFIQFVRQRWNEKTKPNKSQYSRSTRDLTLNEQFDRSWAFK